MRNITMVLVLALVALVPASSASAVTAHGATVTVTRPLPIGDGSSRIRSVATINTAGGLRVTLTIRLRRAYTGTPSTIVREVTYVMPAVRRSGSYTATLRLPCPINQPANYDATASFRVERAGRVLGIATAYSSTRTRIRCVA